MRVSIRDGTLPPPPRARAPLWRQHRRRRRRRRRIATTSIIHRIPGNETLATMWCIRIFAGDKPRAVAVHTLASLSNLFPYGTSNHTHTQCMLSSQRLIPWYAVGLAVSRHKRTCVDCVPAFVPTLLTARYLYVVCVTSSVCLCTFLYNKHMWIFTVGSTSWEDSF